MEIALEAGAEDVAALLIERQAPLNGLEHGRQGPLQAAARGGLIGTAKLLLKRMDVNERDNFRQAALHCAAEHGHPELVNLFLDYGADPKAREGYQGDLPLHSCARKAYWRRAFAIAPGQRRAAAEVLLRAGGDLEGRNGRGETPLHIAAEEGLLEFVQFLVERGADVNAADWSDRTVLDHAQHERRSDEERPKEQAAVIAYLRQRGAK